jgi:CheY-like chemotaxis protein
LPGRLILVVDDEAPLRLLCRFNLERAGFAVVEAQNGEQGIAAARSIRPAAILLDIQMPVANGIDVALTLREDPTPWAPILFLTPRREFAACVNHLALADMSALHEPFNPTLLSGIVRRLQGAALVQEPTSADDMQHLAHLRRIATTPNAIDVSPFVHEWERELGLGNELHSGEPAWAGIVDGRTCPMPTAWDQIYTRLQNIASRRRGELPEPPIPSILGGWHYSTSAQKTARWAETLRWARRAECMHLAIVDESDWHVEIDVD